MPAEAPDPPPTTGPRSAAAAPQRAAAHPRTVLLWILLLCLVAAALYAAAPWLLPARIREGPLVQMAGPDAVTLIWYTTRPVACGVLFVDPGRAERFVPAEATATDGYRYCVRLTGLTPGQRYPYRIRAGGRDLSAALLFETARVADEDLAFIVFGDSGRGSRAQYELAAAMLRTDPPADFLLHTGDIIYPDGERAGYEARFFAPYRALLSRVAFWPCLGNHDVNDNGGAAYRAVFEAPENGPPGLPPEHHYWFDYAAVRVAVVDTNVDEAVLRDRVAPWLREVLAAPGPRWRFVAFHHPPYTAGKYRPDERVQRTLVPVLEETGVDVVFNGHDHNFQRTHPLRGGQVVPAGSGVVYVVTGAGGARLYDVAPAPPPYIADYADDRWSFTHVIVRGDELTLRQIGTDGVAFSRVTWRKTAAEPATPPAPTANLEAPPVPAP